MPDVISPERERLLVTEIQKFPLKEFEFHGYTGKRRVASFGWRYDFSDSKLRAAEPIPDFLLPASTAAAKLAGLHAASLVHVLVTEYRPGTTIGWHRDKAVFGDVVGISLGSPCTFRFRRKVGVKWERHSLILQPRSAYLLRGESRSVWEHSIPAVAETRYSITFRSLR